MVKPASRLTHFIVRLITAPLTVKFLLEHGLRHRHWLHDAETYTLCTLCNIRLNSEARRKARRAFVSFWKGNTCRPHAN